MERLTYRTKDGWVGVNNLEDKIVSPTSVAIHKLAEVEDLMQKYNVEDLGHLDIMLFVLSGETKHQLKEIKQENQALKDRWQKLKEYINNKFNYFDITDEEYSEAKSILNAMEMLEMVEQ